MVTRLAILHYSNILQEYNGLQKETKLLGWIVEVRNEENNAMTTCILQWSWSMPLPQYVIGTHHNWRCGWNDVGRLPKYNRGCSVL